jgi:hypothetical protein
MTSDPTINQELPDGAISHLRGKNINLSTKDLSTGVNILKGEIPYPY